MAYSQPDPTGMVEFRNEARTKLSQVAEQGFNKFTYQYDFGDSWDHLIEVEKTSAKRIATDHPTRRRDRAGRCAGWARQGRTGAARSFQCQFPTATSTTIASKATAENQPMLPWPFGITISAARIGPSADPALPPTWNSDCASP